MLFLIRKGFGDQIRMNRKKKDQGGKVHFSNHVNHRIDQINKVSCL